MEARVGSALLFNALCLHGGCEPGPHRRVSCDIRFFPLCAFLSSEVHTLSGNVMADLRARAAAEESPTLRAPVLEGRCGECEFNLV